MSSKKACLKCNERDGVLVCTNDDCPIVLHKDCMSCAAHFDGEGNFHCPYCVYKRSLGELQRAKELVISAQKTLASFLNYKAVGSTVDVQTAVGTSKRESPDVSGFTFRKGILQHGLPMNREDPTKPVEIGGSHNVRVRVGEIDLKLLNNDLNLVTDNVIPVRLISESMKRPKVVVELDGLGVQRKQTQIELHRSTVCSARGDAMDVDGSSDKIDIATLQDDYTSCEQLKANADQPAESQRGHCDDSKTAVRSLKDDACHAGTHDASTTHKESGIFLKQHIETNNVDEVYHEEMEEKDQQPVDASTRPDINKTSVIGGVTANCVIVNSENSGFEEHASCRKRKRCESMVHTEAVNMASRNQQNKNAMGGNYDGLPEKAHEQSEPREPTEVMNDKAGDKNCTLVDVENISVGHIAVNKNIGNQTSDVGDSHRRRENDGAKQVKLQQHDVNSVSEQNPGLVNEQLDTRDENKPSEESPHRGHRLHCKRKGTQPSSDHEDFEEATQVKSRQKVDSRKQIQYQPPPVFTERRKKLLWTKEEEEILKEGVAKYSLIAKKNLPWMKILEFGSHVFDGTRTPEDLKDKWKRILRKAHANAT